MKRYYISHPYTGNEDANEADAKRIHKALQEKYPECEFVNPIGMCGDKDTDYYMALNRALEILSTCDVIVLCPNWANSAGCRIERRYADQQGMEIILLEELL